MPQISLHPPESRLLIIYQHTLGLKPGKRARFRANVESVSTVMIKTAVACDGPLCYLGEPAVRELRFGYLQIEMFGIGILHLKKKRKRKC